MNKYTKIAKELVEEYATILDDDDKKEELLLAIVYDDLAIIEELIKNTQWYADLSDYVS